MTDNANETTRAIEITFAEHVHVTREQHIRLGDVLSDICKDYEERHPDRVMWVAGTGAKIMVNPMVLADDEPIPFDEGVLVFECAERENYDFDPDAATGCADDSLPGSPEQWRSVVEQRKSDLAQELEKLEPWQGLNTEGEPSKAYWVSEKLVNRAIFSIRDTRLEKAAIALVKACDQLGKDSQHVFTMAHVRGEPYEGKQIGAELDVVRKLLNLPADFCAENAQNPSEE